jgi:hypothetical protein
VKESMKECEREYEGVKQREWKLGREEDGKVMEIQWERKYG